MIPINPSAQYIKIVIVALNKFPITGNFILEIGNEIKKAIINPTISPIIAVTISEVGVF